MGVVINVFYTGKTVEERFISFLIDNDFGHYVDSVRHNDPNWVAANCKRGLFKCRYDAYEPKVDEVTEIEYSNDDDFYVLIVDCKEENLFFYEEVKCFVVACLGEDEMEACWYKTNVLDMFPSQKTTVEEQEIVVAEEPSSSKRKKEIAPENETHYTIDHEDIEEKDYRVYQLTKPNADRPYVVLVRNFSKVGPKRLFSSMRKFDSWGVSVNDTGFLYQVWTHYCELPDTPNFDDILEEHIKACENGEEEPKVWRSNLEDVVNKLRR